MNPSASLRRRLSSLRQAWRWSTGYLFKVGPGSGVGGRGGAQIQTLSALFGFFPRGNFSLSGFLSHAPLPPFAGPGGKLCSQLVLITETRPPSLHAPAGS